MILNDAKKSELKKNSPHDIEYEKLGYEQRIIYAHPRDWYLIMAHVRQVDYLRRKGLRK